MTPTTDEFEVLTWHRAHVSLPDSDTTVLCRVADGECLQGWYDSEWQQWMDAATGGPLERVCWWSEPQGPDAC